MGFTFDELYRKYVDRCYATDRDVLSFEEWKCNLSEFVTKTLERNEKAQPAPATDAAAGKPLSCPSCNNKSDFGLCSVCGGSCFRMGSHTRPEALYNVGMGWQERAERAESEAKRLREELEASRREIVSEYQKTGDGTMDVNIEYYKGEDFRLGNCLPEGCEVYALNYERWIQTQEDLFIPVRTVVVVKDGVILKEIDKFDHSRAMDYSDKS